MVARHFICQRPQGENFQKRNKFIETKTVGRSDFTAHSSPVVFPNLIKLRQTPMGGRSGILSFERENWVSFEGLIKKHYKFRCYYLDGLEGTRAVK